MQMENLKTWLGLEKHSIPFRKVYHIMEETNDNVVSIKVANIHPVTFVTMGNVRHLNERATWLYFYKYVAL